MSDNEQPTKKEDNDAALESLKNESTKRESMKVSRTSTKSQVARMKSLRRSNKFPNVNVAQAIHRTQSGKNSKTPSAEMLLNRASKRRIGGPSFEMYNKEKHPSVNVNKVTSNSNTNTTLQPFNKSNSQVTPVAMSFRASQKTPKPVDLGGRRSSLTGISRERSKSSLSSSFSQNQLQNMTSLTEKGTPEVIIRYGELLKKGVVTAEWKRRFFVLTDKRFYYYTQGFEVPQAFHQIDIPPKGEIPLSVIEDIKKDREDSTGTKFIIYTAARTYRLQIDNNSNADAWIAAIYGACENIKQQEKIKDGINPFNGRRDSFNSIKADELDLSLNNLSLQGSFRNPMKQMQQESLIVSKARKGAKVYKPANIENFVHWSCFDVAAWLYTLELGQYSEMFYQNNIDGKKLNEITKKSQCEELGLEETDVMTLLNGIEVLKKKYLGDEEGEEE